MLAIVYIFALISFASYREIFTHESGLYCTRMYECALTMLHRGATVGIYEVTMVASGGGYSLVYIALRDCFLLLRLVCLSSLYINPNDMCIIFMCT